MDALAHGQGSSSLMHEVGAGGASPASDDVWFVPDDTYYIGYDATDGVCGRPRQVNVTRRIDLGGTSNDYDPVLNLLSSGSCAAPIIDAFLRGNFHNNLLGITTPVELWADAGFPVFIHSNKAMASGQRAGSVILAGYEAVAAGESEWDRVVEVGFEPGAGNNIDVMQYFSASRQLVAVCETAGDVAGARNEVIGYGPVPSSSWQAGQTMAGLEIRDDGVTAPLALCLWGKKDNGAYAAGDGGVVGVNAIILADINTSPINADHCVLLMRWRDDGDNDEDLFLFKRYEMEIAQGTQAAVLGTAADGAAAVGVQIGAENDFTTDGARLVEFVNDETEVRGYVDLNGDLGINMRDNGQEVRFDSLTEKTTIAAAATTDTAIQIPAHCQVYAVSVRVTTVIPTAATFNVGVAGATTRYGSGIAVAAGTTFVGTTDAVRYYAAATSIRITPDLAPAGATGVVRVTIHFIRLTAPTS